MLTYMKKSFGLQCILYTCTVHVHVHVYFITESATYFAYLYIADFVTSVCTVYAPVEY